ncbi:MAG TPA: TMEM175 family protein [Thermoanaerobaculaceae bacterium]|nr:TMEM175 family protein [Thermoanaerobaculaceae bacterium]
MTESPTNILTAPISKTRLEFLYDGIFAIAMTILVLELKIPELAERRSSAELLQHFAHHAPAFGSWLLSIVMLGIFWFRHQQLYRCLHRITRSLLVVHLWLMATAAFFPFCAALVGRYPGNRIAVIAYLGGAWLHVAALTALWIVAQRQEALDPQLDPVEVKQITRRFLRRTIVLLAMAVGYFLLLPQF